MKNSIKSLSPWIIGLMACLTLSLPVAGQPESKPSREQRIRITIKDGCESNEWSEDTYGSGKESVLPPGITQFFWKQIRHLRPDTAGIPENVIRLHPSQARKMFPYDTNLVIVMDGSKAGDSAMVSRVIIAPRGPIFTQEREFNFGFGDEPLHKHKTPTVANETALMLGFTRYDGMNTPVPMELRNGKSINFYIGEEFGLKIDRGAKLRVWSGLGFDVDNYRFNNAALRLQKDRNAISPRIDSSAGSMKSKLVAGYLTVPFYLGFHTKGNPDKGFSVMAGCHLGYRIHAHTKVVQNGAKSKERDDYNLNDWKISPIVMIGYKGMRVYAKYNLQPFLKPGQGPDATQMSFGVVFG
jgi:hypothetical protein